MKQEDGYIHPMMVPVEEVLSMYSNHESTGETSTHRSLCAAGIYLMQDFLDFSDLELLAIPRIGRRRLAIIKRYLRRHGYQLRTEGQFWPTQEEVRERWGKGRKRDDPMPTNTEQRYSILCWENIQAWTRNNPPRCYEVRHDARPDFAAVVQAARGGK